MISLPYTAIAQKMFATLAFTGVTPTREDGVCPDRSCT